jgi:hypothetical protein
MASAPLVSIRRPAQESDRRKPKRRRPEPLLLKGGQLARRLQISVRSLESLVARGVVPAIRLGPKLTRYHLGSVEDALVAMSRGGQGGGDRE